MAETMTYLSPLLKELKYKSFPPFLTLTTKVCHITKLFIHNAAGRPTYVENAAIDIIAKPILDIMRAPFTGGVKYSLFGIDANFGGKFIVDPFSPGVIDSDDIQQLDDAMSDISYLSTSYSVDNKRSVMHLLNCVISAMRFSINAGAYQYMCKINDDTNYANQPPLGLSNASEVYNICPEDLIVVDESGPSDLALFRMTLNPGDRFAHLTGAFPVDDYSKYPQLAFTALSLSNPNLRAFCSAALPNRLEFGMQNEPRVPIPGLKTHDQYILATDTISAQLNHFTLTELQKYNLNMPDMMDFVNSMYPKRDWFVTGVVPYKFYNAYTAVHNILDEAVVMNFVMMSDQIRNAYVIAELMHSSLLADTFRTIVTNLTTQLSQFPLLSIDGSLTVPNQPANTALNMGINSSLMTLQMQTQQETIEQLAIKLTMSLMAQYVLLPATPSTFHQVMDPQLFVQDLIGLVVGNYLYRHLHLRNKVARIQTIHDFLLSYFRVPYSRIFNAQGFGTDAAGNTIITIVGDTRETCRVVVWTLDGIAAAPAALGLLGEVIVLLSLDHNAEAVVYNIPANRYRISPRSVIIPGRISGPSLGSMNVTTNFTLFLQRIISDVGIRYFNSRVEAGTVTYRIHKGPFQTMMGYFANAASSYVSYVETIVHPIYKAYSTLPMLHLNDVTPNYNECVAWRDRWNQDAPAGGPRYSVPYDNAKVVSLPGIPPNIFGSMGAQREFGLFITAACPGCYYQGLSINTKITADLTVFASIYIPGNVVPIIKTYLSNCYRRLLAMEGLEMASAIVRGNMLNSVPVLRDCILRELRTNRLPAAATAIFLDALSVKDDHNNDTSINKMQRSIISSLFEDPRVIHPVRTFVTMADYSGVARSDPWVSRIREHVPKCVDFFLPIIFGDDGLKPITRGMTMSRAPIENLSFDSTHPHIPVSVVVSSIPTIVFGTDYNTHVSYTVEITPGVGLAAVRHNVQNPRDLLKHVRALVPAAGLPAYRFFVANPATITTTEAGFMRTAVELNHALIDHPTSYVLCSYALGTPLEVDQNDSAITLPAVMDFMSTPSVYFSHVPCLDIGYSTYAEQRDAVVRMILPSDPRVPESPMRGFYSNIALPNTHISNEFSYTPSTTPLGAQPMLLDGGIARPAVNVSLYNQTSTHSCLTVKPIRAAFFGNTTV